MAALTTDDVWKALQEVTDPEIPVVSLVEMGIIRDVSVSSQGQIIVTITPTFSGCPALHQMKVDIVEKLSRLGAAEVKVQVSLSPAWTTDWIAAEAHEKLRAFGLAPPPPVGRTLNLLNLENSECPYCGSEETEIRNHFGPTPCRSIFFCRNCLQPFEQFKPL